MKDMYSIKDTIFEDERDTIQQAGLFDKSTASSIAKYLTTIDHEIYGSAAQNQIGSRGTREPGDLDIAVRNTKQTAKRLAAILAYHGYAVRVNDDKFKEWGSVAVESRHRGTWITIIDLHPIGDHQSKKRDYTKANPVMPIKRKGLNVQSAQDQLRRKHASVLNPNMPEKRKKKDTQDYVQQVKDLKTSYKAHKGVKILRADVTRKDVDNAVRMPAMEWIVHDLNKKHGTNVKMPKAVPSCHIKKWKKAVIENNKDPNKVKLTKEGKVWFK